MDKVAEILASAEALTSDERRRLLQALSAIDANGDVEQEPQATDEPAVGDNAIAALLRLAGTARSDYSDLSTDKYKHVAAAGDTRS